MISVPYEVKKALRDGMLRKNYRFVILNDDNTADFTIDNDTLVSESVSIDERMCSGETLQFGLCEGSSLEFQYFNHPNITGRRIQAFIDVEYDPDEDFYPIPMGFFDVKNCSRQASTGIMKVTAYNKLMSDYLNIKANQIFTSILVSDEPVTVYDIRSFLLDEYTIREDRSEIGSGDIPVQEMEIYPSWEANLGTFSFNSLYGKKSPINACEFGITSTSTTFQLWTDGDVAAYSLPAKCQIDARYGSLRALEENVVEFLKKIINDADLDRDWDDVLDYVCTHGGFQSVMCVSDGDVFDVDAARYSTIQWEYEEAHGLPHTVAGTIMDAQRLTTSNRGFNAIVPSHITAAAPSSTMILYEGTISGTPYRDYYEYYIDDTLTTKATELMPYVTFSDGTRYMDHDDQFRNWAIAAFQYSTISDADMVTINYTDLPEFTLREVQSAVYETLCQFGQLSRETDLFSGVDLNHGGLYPAEDLYPANDLYPGGSVLSGSKSMYTKLWADEGNVHKWKYLIITYKALDGDGNEIEKTLQRTVDEHGTDNYNMSDNWIFRSLVWTDVQVADYADAMVAKMRSHIWFPFEMWCAGLPNLETGDEIEIPLNGVVYTSYVLQRQLKGIQNLQDTYINGTLDIFD